MLKGNYITHAHRKCNNSRATVMLGLTKDIATQMSGVIRSHKKSKFKVKKRHHKSFIYHDIRRVKTGDEIYQFENPVSLNHFKEELLCT